MRFTSSLFLSTIQHANDEINTFERPPEFTIFGLSTKSSSIIMSMAQLQHQLERHLVTFKLSSNEMGKIFQETTLKYKSLLKNLFIFLHEPLDTQSKKNLTQILKEYLECIQKILSLVYNFQVEDAITMVSKLKTRYNQMVDLLILKNESLFNEKVSQVFDLSIQLINELGHVVDSSKPERVKSLLKHMLEFSCNTLHFKYVTYFKDQSFVRRDAAVMCVQDLDNLENSLEQLGLYQLPKSITIRSAIDFIKKRIHNQTLNVLDLTLLLNKYEGLGKWINIELLPVDIKSNFDDIKQLILECKLKMEMNNFEWDELMMVIDTLEIFLSKLEITSMNHTSKILKTTLFDFNIFLINTKNLEKQNSSLSISYKKNLFENLATIANITSLLASDEEMARELIFSHEKLQLISQKIIYVVEHWISTRTIKNHKLFHTMLNYLEALWKQMYYGFLSDLHRTIDFESYFVLLEDIAFRSGKEVIRSIKVANLENFQFQSTSFVGLLDYSLCFVRDKCLHCQSSDNFQIIMKRINIFRNKYMQKFYKAFLSIHHFISNNPDIQLPENYLEKFERLCSNIQGELHEFLTLYNIQKIVQSMDNRVNPTLNEPFSDTIKLRVDQFHDQNSNVILTKIWINSAICLMEERPSINFVVVNELGNSILDVRTFEQDDDDIISFLKCLIPNTVVVISITNPSDTKLSQPLLNYFTFINSKLALKFQNSSKSNFDGAILIGYVGTHRLIHWYHEQFNVISPNHSYEGDIPTPLAFSHAIKIEISYKTTLSVSNIDNCAGFSSICINGVEYIRSTEQMFISVENCHESGYCYVFDNPQKPHFGKLVQMKVTDIEDFINGISSGSVCCFLFPNGIDKDSQKKDRVEKFFEFNDPIADDDMFAAIYLNNDSLKENLRFTVTKKTSSLKLLHYIKNNSSSGICTFVNSNNDLENNDNSNNLQHLIKTVKKQNGDKLNKLKSEFDKIQTDFLSQLQKTSLICAHENLSSDKDGPLNDSQFDNSVLGYARQINILVSYLVDLTRNEGPLASDSDIINNCVEIKRLGEALRLVCLQISDKCKTGTTKSELVTTSEELPLFLQQLLVLSKVNYGSVSSLYKSPDSASDAMQITSSLIVTSTNIMKTIINLVKFTHSAKVQYKLNIDINFAVKNRSSYNDFMTTIQNLQETVMKPSTL